MFSFKDQAVNKKYKNTNGDADPIVRVAIQYHGPLSKVPLSIADKLYADGAHIALKSESDEKKISSEKP